MLAVGAASGEGWYVKNRFEQDVFSFSTDTFLLTVLQMDPIFLSQLARLSQSRSSRKTSGRGSGQNETMYIQNSHIFHRVTRRVSIELEESNSSNRRVLCGRL